MVGIMGVGIYAVSKGGNAAQVEAVIGAKAEVIGERSKDWGRIKMSEGDAVAEFTIQSKGDKQLQLYNLKTSCACTRARLESDQSVSPYFNMHSTSDYVLDVKPGDMVKVVAIFDPAFHGPSGVGSISRTITMQTNDPDNPELTFNAKAEVYR